MTGPDSHDGIHLTPGTPSVLAEDESTGELLLYSIDPVPFPSLAEGWAALFANASLDAQRRIAADRRRYMAGPNRFERRIARIYGIPPQALGLAPPPLAINGNAYRRRQRNRVKRGRR